MKKILIFSIALFLSLLHVTFSQYNTLQILEQVKQHKTLPKKQETLQKDAISKISNSLSRTQHLFPKTKNPSSSNSLPSILNLSFPNNANSNSFYIVEDFRIHWDKNFNTPRFIEPQKLNVLVGSKYHNFALGNAFYAFVENFSNLFQLKDPKNELKEKENIVTSDKFVVIRYSQHYNDIPIWGKEILAHFNKTGELSLIISNIVPTLNIKFPNNVKINQSYATSIALNDLRNKTIFEEIPEPLMKYFSNQLQKTELYYFWDDPAQVPKLVWVVELRPNLYEKYRYFIDAETGTIVQYYRANPSDGPTTGMGIDLFNVNRKLNVFLNQGRYYLVDATKPMFNNNISKPDGVIVTYTNNYSDLSKTSRPNVVSSNSSTFNDPVAVSLHYHMGLVYDYYYTAFNRNSIDGNKKNVVGIIHVTDNGQSVANAFWTGEFMVFGDGDNAFLPLARGLDVVAHEFTHGVVQYTVDLEYKFQSGALNEGFADWGGAMVDREDWLIGEDVVNPQYFPSGTMRNMSDPHNQAYPGHPNWLPAHMNEYQDLPLEKDNGGVHINVGIINKATYLIGNAIGKDKLEKIYYRVLDKRYLTKQANFIDFRIACERSAKELFGDNSTELLAVKNAFDDVGIGSSGASSPEPDLPPVRGNHYILAVDQQMNYLYRLNEILRSPSDIIKISNNPVFTESGSVIAPLENGAGAFYIDFNNNIRFIDLNNLTDEEIAGEGIYRSIAISGGKFPKIAVTLTDYSPQILIYDINSDSVKIIDLYTPTTTHTVETIEPLFAVNLSWTPSGKYLAYDVINVRFELNGDTTYYAEVNLLDPNSGRILRITPPMPYGIHLASPTFSQTNDNRIAFVIWNEFTNTSSIVIGDLYTGNASQIVQSSLLSDQISTLTFSPNDTAILFQSFQPSYNQYVLYKIKLKSDKFSPDGYPYVYATEAGIPRWYAVGIRSSADLETQTVIPFQITNYDNEINISLPDSLFNESITVSLYNILGHLLITKNFNSYVNQVKLNLDGYPSGIYLVQIQIRHQDYVSKIIFNY